MLSKPAETATADTVSRSSAVLSSEFKRVMNVALRVAVVVFDMQHFSVAGAAIAVLEATVLSVEAVFCWVVCLVGLAVIDLSGVKYPFDALLIARAIVFAVLISQRRFLASNRFVTYIVERVWRLSPLFITGLCIAAAGFMVGCIYGPVGEIPQRLVALTALIYISRHWHNMYLLRGGKSVGGFFDHKNLMVSAVAIVLFLVGFELVVRVIAPQTPYQPTGIFIPHPERAFDIAPNSERQYSSPEYSVRFVTNELGLKDHAIGQKTDGTFRILCVGDSFTLSWGVPIEEAYPKMLEQLIRAEHGDVSVEVINLGSLGYSIPHHLSRMREFGFDLDPDLVILQFYPENDIQDTIYYAGKLLESNNVRKLRQMDEFLGETTLPARLRNWMRRRSHAFVFVYDRLQILKERNGWIGRAEKSYPVIPGRPVCLESSLKEYYPALEEAWQLMETYTREFRDECAARGIPLIAFEVPSKFELGGKLRSETLRYVGAVAEPYDFSKNWRFTHEMFERLEIPYLDLYTALLETGRPERYYWKQNCHMNRDGNVFLAELLHRPVWTEYCKWADSKNRQQRDGEIKN